MLTAAPRPGAGEQARGGDAARRREESARAEPAGAQAFALSISPAGRALTGAVGEGRAGDAVRAVVGSGGWRPLDPATRAFFEAGFGRSLGGVRVHTGAAADASARAVDALAYTVGRHVVFRTGRFAPETADGRKLLAHELAHVVQQSGSPAAEARARLEIGPADAPEEREAEAAAAVVARGGRAAPPQGGAKAALRRKPGENAEESWAALVDRVDVPDAKNESEETTGRQARADEAARRMLATPSGARLANELYAALCRKDRCSSRIHVLFVDQLPEKEGEGATGFFKPSTPGEPRYQVWVRNEFPPQPGVTRVGGLWPRTGTGWDIFHGFTDAESDMAETLFHEVLHVWFVNTQQGTYPTGHGDVEKGEFEPVFHERLKAVAAELEELETRARAEQASAPEAPAAEEVADLDFPERRGPRRRLVGGRLSVQAGGAWGGGLDSATGIVGADLILGDIYALQVGVRGIYLTPDRLLAGGTVGLRVRGGTRVDRPVIFDIEAGVLKELSPSDADRFTDRLAGFGSLGISQEYGRSGTRFFWRVGAFVIVSDRALGEREAPPGGGRPSRPVAGGGTFGVGWVF